VPNDVQAATFVDSNVDAQFSLDNGTIIKQYKHLPSKAHGLEYNVMMASMENLPNTEHELVISPIRGMQNSVLMFDYAEYTYVCILSSIPSYSSVLMTFPVSMTVVLLQLRYQQELSSVLFLVALLR
jgi:hypothetical protein